MSTKKTNDTIIKIVLGIALLMSLLGNVTQTIVKKKAIAEKDSVNEKLVGDVDSLTLRITELNQEILDLNTPEAVKEIAAIYEEEGAEEEEVVIYQNNNEGNKYEDLYNSMAKRKAFYKTAYLKTKDSLYNSQMLTLDIERKYNDELYNLNTELFKCKTDALPEPPEPFVSTESWHDMGAVRVLIETMENGFKVTDYTINSALLGATAEIEEKKFKVLSQSNHKNYIIKFSNEKVIGLTPAGQIHLKSLAPALLFGNVMNSSYSSSKKKFSYKNIPVNLHLGFGFNSTFNMDDASNNPFYGSFRHGFGYTIGLSTSLITFYPFK